MTERNPHFNRVNLAQIERIRWHAAPVMKPEQILAALEALPPDLHKATAHEGLSRAIRRQMRAAHARAVDGVPV
jgi:hypothetical protein